MCDIDGNLPSTGVGLLIAQFLIFVIIVSALLLTGSHDTSAVSAKKQIHLQ